MLKKLSVYTDILLYYKQKSSKKSHVDPTPDYLYMDIFIISWKFLLIGYPTHPPFFYIFFCLLNHKCRSVSNCLRYLSLLHVNISLQLFYYALTFPPSNGKIKRACRFLSRRALPIRIPLDAPSGGQIKYVKRPCFPSTFSLHSTLCAIKFYKKYAFFFTDGTGGGLIF